MKKLTIILVACLISTGCASIASKSSYDVVIQSSPSDAQFTVTNKSGTQLFSGNTPMTVSLPASSGYFKNESYVIAIGKAGYSQKTYTLTSSLDGWYWGNLFIGGLLGMLVVDPLSGAMYKLPAEVDVSLDADTAQSTATELKVTSIEMLNDEQRSQLQAITI